VNRIEQIIKQFFLSIKPKLEAGETISVSTRTYLEHRYSGSTAGWTVASALAKALETQGLIVIRRASDGWRYLALPRGKS
jgi:hypothetical protein